MKITRAKSPYCTSGYRYPKIHSCEKMAGLFMKFLPRRTFEQMIHKFGLRHLNDVSLHEGEK